MIIAQDLVNAGNTNTSNTNVDLCYVTYSNEQKLFPLSTKMTYSTSVLNQLNYLIHTYLTTDALRISYMINTTNKARYWLRNTTVHRHDPCFVNLSGVMTVGDNTAAGGSATASSGSSYDVNCDANFGVRPAGVFKLG